MTGELRLAVVGCGRIARLVHLPTLARMAGVKVAALADPDAGSLAAAGRLAPGAAAHADWRDAIGAGVDAVVVTSPPATHAEVALAALAAGRAVYVEKPLATTLADGEAMAAAAAGRTAQVGLNFRHSPLFRDLAARIRGGALGEVVAVRTIFTSARRELPEWKQSRAGGGGVIRDLGVHHLDLVEYLLGEPIARIGAAERTVAAEADTAQLTAVSASGVSVGITVSLASGRSVNQVEVLGSAGHLLADTGDATLPPVAGGDGGQGARLGRAVAGLAPARWLGARGEPSFAAALGAFADAARAGRAADPDLSVGLRALRLVLAAEQAAASGRTVDA